MSTLTVRFHPLLYHFVRQIHTHFITPYFLVAQNELLNHLDHLLQESNSLEQSKQIHTQIIITGSSQSGFLASRLISNYSRFGLLVDAQKVFETISVDSSSLLFWNSIIRAHTKYANYEESINLYVRLKNLGVKPDGFTLPLVIRACASIGGYDLCRIVHSHVLQLGLRNNLHVVNELLRMFAKSGRMDIAYRLFDRMPVRSYISWNTLISGFSMNYDCQGAVEMFRRMEFEGWEPNIVTWTSLLSSYARCGCYEETLKWLVLMRRRGIGANAEALAVVLSSSAGLNAVKEGSAVHGYVVKGGFEGFLIVKNSLICMHGKNGDLKGANNLFSEMEARNLVTWNSLVTAYADYGACDEAFEIFSQLEKSDDCAMLRPDVVTWSAVIGGFASKGRGREALDLFRKMQLAKVQPNPITISSVLSACADLAVLPLGREVHAYVVRLSMDNSILVGNGLINMYTKCGCLKQGDLVFEKLDARDLVSWNSMIAGYGVHGYGKFALGFFAKMLRDGIKLDEVTFVALLSACAHSGLVSEGRKIFAKMKDEFDVELLMEHYACVVDLLARAGLVEEAKEIISHMPMEPNEVVWGALLNASRFSKNPKIAEEAASHISSSDSEVAGSYMLLSNIYAASGRWDESAKVRLSARINGLRKTPGLTWIQVKKKVYEFSAGNAPFELEELYKILEDLGRRMEIEGYIPDKSFVLQNVDEDEKIRLLNGHSEKLAIAFGYRNIPPNMPIRIMKNLRVCGDCHNWTKYFSKVTGREVIVRDARRFHHFLNGYCSCKDYW